jgi:hypothetical protein
MAESTAPGVDFHFSADSEHYAFVASRGGTEFVVADGVEGPHFDQVRDLHLSATGDLVAYAAGKSPQEHVVVNGQAGPGFYSVKIEGVSPDGRQVAYAVDTGTVMRIFLGPEPQIEFPNESDPVYGYRAIEAVAFSRDSRHFAFAAMSNQGYRVVLDRKTVGNYSGLASPLFFSPDGRRLAFFVEKHARAVGVVVDGVELPLEGELAEYGLYFPDLAAAWSPDSRHFAYVVTRDSRLHIVLDGVESPGYERLAYHMVRFLQDGRLAYSALDGGVWTTYIGAERFPGMRLVGITPDGVHRAFLAGGSNRQLLVDGKRYEAPGPVQFSSFSPAGKHFLYSYHPYGLSGDYDATDGVVVRSGAEVFSPDERHVAIIDKANIRIDNSPILPADAGSPHCGIYSFCFSFDGNDRFHAFATRGNRVVRIDGRF